MQLCRLRLYKDTSLIDYQSSGWTEGTMSVLVGPPRQLHT
jgi:hypothetical protein